MQVRIRLTEVLVDVIKERKRELQESNFNWVAAIKEESIAINIGAAEA